MESTRHADFGMGQTAVANDERSTPDPARKAEEARAGAEEELRREQELLRTIVDRIPVMIALYRPNANIIDMNAEFRRAIGWSTEDTAGRSLMEECHPDPQERAKVAA